MKLLCRFALGSNSTPSVVSIKSDVISQSEELSLDSIVWKPGQGPGLSQSLSQVDNVLFGLPSRGQNVSYNHVLFLGFVEKMVHHHCCCTLRTNSSFFSLSWEGSAVNCELKRMKYGGFLNIKRKKMEVFFIWFEVHTHEIHRRCMSEDWAAAYFLSFVISFGDLIRHLNIVKGGNSIMGPTRMHPGSAKTNYFPLICFFVFNYFLRSKEGFLV